MERSDRWPFRNQYVLQLFSAKRKELPMLATAVTLALLGLVASMLASLVRQDGRKIVAALQGRSWTAQPPASFRPVQVRFTQRYPSARPVRQRQALSAAA